MTLKSMFTINGCILDYIPQVADLTVLVILRQNDSLYFYVYVSPTVDSLSVASAQSFPAAAL